MIWDKIKTNSPEAYLEFCVWLKEPLFWVAPFSMQSGVIIQYFDERGIHTDAFVNDFSDCVGTFRWEIHIPRDTFYESVAWCPNGAGVTDYPKARPEALEAAIERSFEIRNEQLNNNGK
jgi:hypothetical protein